MGTWKSGGRRGTGRRQSGGAYSWVYEPHHYEIWILEYSLAFHGDRESPKEPQAGTVILLGSTPTGQIFILYQLAKRRPATAVTEKTV